MPNPRLATRYAKSILDLAGEKGELEAVYKDIVFLQQLCNESRDLVNMLRSPVIPSDKKQAVLDALTKGRVNEITMAFTRLLVNKGREGELQEVLGAFIRQYKDLKGIHTVKLTTATPVSESVKKAIVEQVKKTSNMQHIELEARVNPDIIGGFVLQAGDQLVDASISYDLRQISRQFENNDFIYKVR
jgi:F-type H+-transporting ATPase subunit delta